MKYFYSTGKYLISKRKLPDWIRLNKDSLSLYCKLGWYFFLFLFSFIVFHSVERVCSVQTLRFTLSDQNYDINGIQRRVFLQREGDVRFFLFHAVSCTVLRYSTPPHSTAFRGIICWVAELALRRHVTKKLHI